MSPEQYVATVLQTPPRAFNGFVPPNILALRAAPASWQFGMEVLNGAHSLLVPGARKLDRVCVSRLNHAAINATWYKVPGAEDSYVIAVNDGLVEVLDLIAGDIFGPGSEEQAELLSISSEAVKVATPRVRSRIGAFLETGFPLANEPPTSISSGRQSLVRSLVADALRFAVLHEVAHILLHHDQAPQAVLRNRYTTTAIAIFSMEAEHQADDLAIRLHASLRSTEDLKFPGMEFAGVVLFFGVLALFERHQNYERAFDTPHHHPPAYERLYRLRLDMSAGGGHKYWTIPEGDGFRLARMDLKPSATAVEFGDVVARVMLDTLRGLGKEGELFSPMNSLMNTFLDETDEHKAIDTTCDKLSEWFFLGSPTRIMQHLAELLVQAPSVAKTDEDKEDQRRMQLLIDAFVRKVRHLSGVCSDVSSALDRFQSFVQAPTS